jgi:hypothetical protein
LVTPEFALSAALEFMSFRTRSVDGFLGPGAMSLRRALSLRLAVTVGLTVAGMRGCRLCAEAKHNEQSDQG